MAACGAPSHSATQARLRCSGEVSRKGGERNVQIGLKLARTHTLGARNTAHLSPNEIMQMSPHMERLDEVRLRGILTLSVADVLHHSGLSQLRHRKMQRTANGRSIHIHQRLRPCGILRVIFLAGAARRMWCVSASHTLPASLRNEKTCSEYTALSRPCASTKPGTGDECLVSSPARTQHSADRAVTCGVAPRGGILATIGSGACLQRAAYPSALIGCVSSTGTWACDNT